MRAKEYFEKYKDEFIAAKTDEEIESAVLRLHKEMVDEKHEITKQI